MRRLHARRLPRRAEQVPDSHRRVAGLSRGGVDDRVADGGARGRLSGGMRSDPSSLMAPTLHDLTGKTIAVTGAAGYIGGALVGRLADIDCEIIRVSRRESPRPI